MPPLFRFDADRLTADEQRHGQRQVPRRRGGQVGTVTRSDGDLGAEVGDEHAALAGRLELEVLARKRVFVEAGDNGPPISGYDLPLGVQFFVAVALAAQLHRPGERVGVDRPVVVEHLDA